MSKLTALLIFSLCFYSTFASNFELKTVTEKFKNSFNEVNNLQRLHLNEEDKKFYNSLRSLISYYETEALRSSLLDLIHEYNSSVVEINKKVKNLEEQLSVVNKLLKSDVSEMELNQHSGKVLKSLDEIVYLLKLKQIKPLTFDKLFFTQSIEFYSNETSLALKLFKIEGNSSLRHNFVNTFKIKGQYKFYEIRDQLIANHRSKRSAKEVGKVLGYWACKVLDFATKHFKFEKPIADYIFKYVPDEYKSELLNTLMYKGIVALTNLARKLCGQQTIEATLALIHGQGMAVNNRALVKTKNMFTIYNDLFPKKEVDFEFFTTFIQWYRLSLQNGFVSIQTEVDVIASYMKWEIRQLTDEMSNIGNDILTVYSNDLDMDQFLKQSIRFRAIDLKNTLYF